MKKNEAFLKAKIKISVAQRLGLEELVLSFPKEMRKLQNSEPP